MSAISCARRFALVTCTATVLTAAAKNRRLEPIDGQVLHMAGQSPQEYDGYAQYLPSASRPLGYTTYHSFTSLNKTGAGVDYFDKLRNALDKLYGADEHHVVLPHVSLALTPGFPVIDLINAGAYDLAITELVKGLPRAGRPVFLRMGYEANGHWNNYTADGYIKAWRRIEAAIATNVTQRDRTALVWDVTCDEKGGRTDVAKFYPGDAYVDWWGVNTFQIGQGFNSMPNSTCVLDFVSAAANQTSYSTASFPVLVAEAMPRYIGTDNVSSWEYWFEPFFETLLSHTNVKGFSYIDRNCNPFNGTHGDAVERRAQLQTQTQTQTQRVLADLVEDGRGSSSRADAFNPKAGGGASIPHTCVGGQWGDARIETSIFMGAKYAAKVQQPGFVHASSLSETCVVLGLVC